MIDRAEKFNRIEHESGAARAKVCVAMDRISHGETSINEPR